jgi:hypothetical protein
MEGTPEGMSITWLSENPLELLPRRLTVWAPVFVDVLKRQEFLVLHCSQLMCTITTLFILSLLLSRRMSWFVLLYFLNLITIYNTQNF